ncbi:MAG: ABC transporter ATP-binding protein [Candidatus Wallbacteria bacterium]|nr:ABC transporter ATP-binding protein [Candidatus Wallbacteria bacterium]
MPLVNVINLSRHYEQGGATVLALDDATLEINPGEFTVLAGPSGSGKTTFLNLLGCMDTPTTGKIVIDGEDVTAFTPRLAALFRRKKIGFVFQHFYLIPVLSVYENVEFSLDLLGGLAETEKKAKVMETLEQLGIAGLASRRPSQLSGGQQQRVAIARALVKDPVLILADEPTASLDSVNGEAILNAMKELNQNHGVTIVFSSHDRMIIEIAKRIVHLKDGRIDSIEVKA